MAVPRATAHQREADTVIGFTWRETVEMEVENSHRGDPLGDVYVWHRINRAAQGLEERCGTE